MSALLVLGALLALVAYNVADSYFTQARQHARLLERAPVTRLADAREDVPAKFVGVVRCVEPLLSSPVEQRPCVLYRLVLREQRPQRPWASHWVRVFQEEQAQELVLEDESGSLTLGARSFVRNFRTDEGLQVLREPSSFDEVELVGWPVRAARDGDGAAVEGLQRRHRFVRTSDGGCSVQEDTLEAGARIAVYGVLRGGRLRRAPGLPAVLLSRA
jgi:hypothetical protein